MKMNKKTLLLLTILAVAISLCMWMGLGMLICWAFGWTFNAKIVFGLWLVLILIRNILC